MRASFASPFLWLQIKNVFLIKIMFEVISGILRNQS